MSAISKNYSWILYSLVTLVYLLVPFHRVSPAIMAGDIMHDLSLTAPAMGVLASTFFVIYGLMQMPGGLLADGIGPRRLLPVMVGISGIGVLCFGVADSFWLALVGRGIMGFGVSVIFLCGMQIIGQWFPKEQFGRLSGLFLGMGGVGIIMASGPLAALCVSVGWRAAFLGCGIFTLAMAVLLVFTVRDAPGRSNKGIDFALMAGNLRLVVAERNFWCACVWLFAQFNLHMSFGGLWGGTYLMDVRGMSQMETGQILSVTGFGVIVGGLLVGYLCDVLFRSCRKTMLFCGAIATGNFVLLALFGHMMPVWGLYLWFFVMATFGVPAGTASFSAMRQLFGEQSTASACGLLNCLPSVGALVLQPLTGYVLEIYGRSPAGGFTVQGYAMGCWLFVGVGVLGFFGAVFMKEK